MSAAFSRSGDRARGLDIGADGYLVEPVDTEVLVSTVRGLVRKRRAEVAAHEAARHWQTTFDAINDAVCLLDGDGNVARANRRFADLAATPDLGAPDSNAAVTALLRRTTPPATVGELLAAGERVVREARVGERWLQVTVDPVSDEGHRGGVFIVADVTDRKRSDEERQDLLSASERAREAAETVSQSKDEFLAVLSHELRTPLTAMLGWLRMLAGGRLDEERRAHALAVVERNARLQAQLVEDLLDVSRIVSGKMTLAMAPVSLMRAVEAAVDGVEELAAAKGVRLALRIRGEPGVVVGDAGRLEQIFSNLLTNAVKFTPAGGAVTVSVEGDGRVACVHVVDTGAGIPAELLPHVFDRFWQGDSLQRRTQRGLGLGLTIARHLVELHGGKIAASSDGTGHGATFTVTLNAAVTGQPQAPPSPRPAGRRDLARVRVLLVEDDADTLEVITAILRQAGAEVEGATSGNEALARLRESVPDVLLSDIGLPGTDGYELIRLVRSLPPVAGGCVPAIAITAFARAEDARKALLAGFDRHLAKPVDEPELTATILDVVARSLGRTSAIRFPADY
jgi:signal transduction histidine kinase/ActR/RegA family two-component response regulator